MTVERGRGYVSADRNKRSSTIGVIPVDSIFSPIRLVSFTVEPTRVEQSTNYDRLVLDITTDGSITPQGGAGLRREHPALAGRPGRRHERVPPGPRARRGRRRRQRLARPGPARSRSSTCPSGPATA